MNAVDVCPPNCWPLPPVAELLDGLVDEIRVHVIPVLLDGGTPLFATLDSSIVLERTRTLVTPAATHIGFRVVA